MTATNPPGGAAKLLERGTASVAAPDLRPGNLGRVHAIPVSDLEVAPGGVAETVYRVAEIALASIALIVGLPFLLAAAVLVTLELARAYSFQTQTAGAFDLPAGARSRGTLRPDSATGWL